MNNKIEKPPNKPKNYIMSLFDICPDIEELIVDELKVLTKEGKKRTRNYMVPVF